MQDLPGVLGSKISWYSLLETLGGTMPTKYADFSPRLWPYYTLRRPPAASFSVVKPKESAENSHFLRPSEPEASPPPGLLWKNTLKYRRFLGFLIDPRAYPVTAAELPLWCFSFLPLLFWLQSVEILSSRFFLLVCSLYSSQFMGSCREKYVRCSPLSWSLYTFHSGSDLGWPGMTIFFLSFSCH